MAISVKEVRKIQKEKEDAPLTPEELSHIALVEKYIDEEVMKKSDQSDVYIFLYYVTMETDVVENKRTSFPDYRRNKMQKELESRYKAAGWRASLHLDDGLDGPNRSGPDYWVLSKRKIK